MTYYISYEERKMKKQYLVIGAVIIVILLVLAFSYILLQQSPTEEKLTVTTNPFLWKIEGNVTSYLYGSIHLPNQAILTIPDVVYDALDEVDCVYTEVKLTPETQSISFELSLLPEDQTLDDLLPQEVLHRLQSYLSSKKISYADFSRLKIWAIATSLVVIEEVENYINYISLDQHIWNIADSKGKYLDEIESIEEQISIFDSFTIDEQIRMLTNALDELEYYNNLGKSITGEIINAYINGDLQALQDLTFLEYDENDPYDVKFITLLLTERNINMAHKISDLLINKPETQYFFTVGAGHFYGEDGLISLLEDEGFTISRVEFNISEECDSGEIMIDGRCYIPYD
jgi:uncharacterized protein